MCMDTQPIVTTHTLTIGTRCLDALRGFSPPHPPPPTSSPTVNFEACVYPRPVYTIQKAKYGSKSRWLPGMQDSIKRRSVAQVVPFQKNGSEIAKAHWSGQACMLNRYVVFFPACAAAFNVTFESLKPRADQGKRPQWALSAAERLFPRLTSISFSLCS